MNRWLWVIEIMENNNSKKITFIRKCIKKRKKWGGEREPVKDEFILIKYRFYGEK